MPLVELIDEAVKLASDNTPRSHLGGSLIGRGCERELWYSFRWASRPSFSGRMLRLFERGQKEEDQFVSVLRLAGVEVREFSERLLYSAYQEREFERNPTAKVYWTFPWDTPLPAGFKDVTSIPYHRDRAKADFNVSLKQWRILDIEGHFGGSLDGLARGFPPEAACPVNLAPDEFALVEFKTHNSKSFAKLVLESVKQAKPEHFAQMQIYMRKKNLRVALYMAVDKNTDELYTEWVIADYEFADELLVKARRIIHARSHPNRQSQNMFWFGCKWCDFRQTCHMGEPMDKTCRSCSNAAPVEGGEWHCSKWGMLIPSVDAALTGCDSYSPIRD